MPWLIWVCPLQSSVHCQEHKLGDGRDREVMLPWHSRFCVASAETHMSRVMVYSGLFTMEMSLLVLEIPWFVQQRCGGVWSGGSLTPPCLHPALPGSD